MNIQKNILIKYVKLLILINLLMIKVYFQKDLKLLLEKKEVKLVEDKNKELLLREL